MKKLSWKPRRRGKIYCSPACGAKCTWEQYQEMKRLGEKMRLSMRNPKLWRIHIHENLRWHVCLEHIPTNGYLTVYPGFGRSYHTLLSLIMSHAGDMDWSNDKSFRTPQKAVDYILDLARRVMVKKNAVMTKFDGI